MAETSGHCFASVEANKMTSRLSWAASFIAVLVTERNGTDHLVTDHDRSGLRGHAGAFFYVADEKRNAFAPVGQRLERHHLRNLD
jgi:hypothetical protein